MRKFKIGDRVILRESLTYIGGLEGEIVDDNYNLVWMVYIEHHGTALLKEDDFELDIQYYRNERLNEILDESSG